MYNKEKQKLYYQKNKDRIAQRQKEYHLKNKEKISQYQKNRYAKKFKGNTEFLENNKIKCKKYWQKNKKYEIEKQAKERLTSIRWLEDYKRDKKCIKCGFNHPAALDFHHRNPADKKYLVPYLASHNFSKEKILEEIAKCDILCANCHRIYHYENNHRRAKNYESKTNGNSDSFIQEPN